LKSAGARSEGVLNQFANVLFLGALFTLGSIYSPSVYSHQNGSNAVVIHGILHCHDWKNARTTDSSIALEHAVQGFLNGYAMGSGIDLWRQPDDILPSTFFNALDAQCAENLFQPVVTAIHELLRQRGTIE